MKKSYMTPAEARKFFDRLYAHLERVEQNIESDAKRKTRNEKVVAEMRAAKRVRKNPAAKPEYVYEIEMQQFKNSRETWRFLERHLDEQMAMRRAKLISNRTKNAVRVNKVENGSKR